jgi:hypothetical protein
VVGLDLWWLAEDSHSLLLCVLFGKVCCVVLCYVQLREYAPRDSIRAWAW